MGILADVLERDVAAATLRSHRHAHPHVVKHGLLQGCALVKKAGKRETTVTTKVTVTSTVMRPVKSTAVTANGNVLVTAVMSTVMTTVTSTEMST